MLTSFIPESPINIPKKKLGDIAAEYIGINNNAISAKGSKVSFKYFTSNEILYNPSLE